jgi:hypothetical protein
VLNNKVVPGCAECREKDQEASKRREGMVLWCGVKNNAVGKREDGKLYGGREI